MASNFDVPPGNVLTHLEPFTLHVSEEELEHFKKLLEMSNIGPTTWWNQQDDSRFGVSREWLLKAKDIWLSTFDWRKHEVYINNFPNFKVTIKETDSCQIDVHFAALFSKRKDAIPIVFLHGFPSSFMDFLPMMDLLRNKYTPESLPYHIIAPSLPDYGLSGSLSQNLEMTLERAASIMNGLMIALGFEKGYVAQGGDLGSMIARLMSVNHKECKAFHVNMLTLEPGSAPPSTDCLAPEDLRILERTLKWQQDGLAYALEHGTRPATVGLAISSSPLSLLAWLGEKLLEWTDPREQLPLDTILGLISFYWFTQTFPRSLYHANLVKNYSVGIPHPISTEKPLGYSMFAYDLAVLPKPWVQEIYPNLAFFNAHSKGGHFASLERPSEFLEDIERFLQAVNRLFEVE
ncbi:hypothetical protein Asppvi_005422 [Aspergillus pseudoviridinutans]|uniref:Epoxide hydrolase N-terminal domain-containing protein n=1 Tax=Aspergillus pseudoviridinutans TaxID=1517512 RepID=A0A9P3BCA2_9EURO|nr:uncharacterized protein Asppvi_005422 [Aspergillus pseudoviridinutans]GIJ86533.1 hypothetical protein Asppvi_005422 [Aspergillus pseudoviridinutans]